MEFDFVSQNTSFFSIPAMRKKEVFWRDEIKFPQMALTTTIITMKQKNATRFFIYNLFLCYFFLSFSVCVLSFFSLSPFDLFWFGFIYFFFAREKRKNFEEKKDSRKEIRVRMIQSEFIRSVCNISFPCFDADGKEKKISWPILIFCPAKFCSFIFFSLLNSQLIFFAWIKKARFIKNFVFFSRLR